MRTDVQNIEKIFQDIDFSENYYRIELRQSDSGSYAYFYHPGIYSKMIQLASKPQDIS